MSKKMCMQIICVIGGKNLIEDWHGYNCTN